MSDPLRSKLAPFYDAILPPIFDVEAPKEQAATCHDCAMCDKGAPSLGTVYFSPDTKCCTYHPTLPSYLVGGILSDDSPEQAEGRRRIQERIRGRTGVTPRWVAPTPKYWLLWSAARASSFGRSKTLVCPYLDGGGLCSIWRYREAECSTFFCKHDGGLDGKQLWNAVRDYVRHAERALAAHAASVVAPELVEPPQLRETITLEELEDRPPADDDYAALWGRWIGREEELYRASFDVVRALDRAEVARIVHDAEGLRLRAALEERHSTLVSTALPDRLVLNPEASIAPAEGGAVVTTFSRYEPLFVNDQLLEVLREMSARESVADFRGRLLRDHEVDVPESALVSLHRFRVVVEPK